MIGLFITAALLVTGTVWFIARPLAQADNQTDQVQRSELERVRDRLLAQLNELDAEHRDHGIDGQVARDEELRISAELAQVLKNLEANAAASASRAAPMQQDRRLWRVTWLSLALVLSVVSIGLYAWQNGPVLTGLVQMALGRDPAAAQVPPMVMQMVERLEKRLQENPEDAEGWARLGRSYYVLERLDKARVAYGKAYALVPDNVDVLADYAWLVFNADPDSTTGLVHTLYKRLNQLQPQNPDALWFLGLAAYRDGKLRETIKFWEQLEKVVAKEDPAQVTISQAIAKVKAELQKNK